MYMNGGWTYFSISCCISNILINYNALYYIYMLCNNLDFNEIELTWSGWMRLVCFTKSAGNTTRLRYLTRLRWRACLGSLGKGKKTAVRQTNKPDCQFEQWKNQQIVWGRHIAARRKCQLNVCRGWTGDNAVCKTTDSRSSGVLDSRSSGVLGSLHTS